jgi:hypothetical protein
MFLQECRFYFNDLKKFKPRQIYTGNTGTEKISAPVPVYEENAKS